MKKMMESGHYKKVMAQMLAMKGGKPVKMSAKSKAKLKNLGKNASK